MEFFSENLRLHIHFVENGRLIISLLDGKGWQAAGSEIFANLNVFTGLLSVG